MTTRPVSQVPEDLAGRLDLLARLLRLTVESAEIRPRVLAPKMGEAKERVRCALEDVLEARTALAAAQKSAAS